MADWISLCSRIMSRGSGWNPDQELALEMVENFFLQIYTCNKVRSWVDTDFFRGVPMFQNLTIGGVDPETMNDATNEMSYICLDATYNTRIPQPSLTVRFQKIPHGV